MAGRGPAPSEDRRRRNEPERGEWRPAAGTGWQHGEVPDPPELATEAAREAWATWFASWFAANWSPDDLPGLRLTAQLYDMVQAYIAEPYSERETKRGDVVPVPKPNPATELRQLMDNYGITPKGQQDRRWKRPEAADPVASDPVDDGPYSHLRVVGG